MMKLFANKKTLLTLASGACGIGSVIVELISKKDATDAVAEKAAKIVMEQLNKK